MALDPDTRRGGDARRFHTWVAAVAALVVLTGLARPDNRRAQPPAKLLAATARWLLELPQGIRPYALAKLYPRIANDLCRLWRQPALWQQYASDLMIVRRDDRPRQGFPARVASELAARIAHHTQLYPPLPVRGGPDAFR